MLNKPTLTIGLTTIAISLASCSSDDIPAPDAQEIYHREFIKDVGIIDPQQDWNMATQKSVTVVPGRSGSVQIYVMKSDTKYALVGDFSDVRSGETLWFDTTCDTQDVLVVSDGYGVTAKVGSSVDLSSGNQGRTVYEGTTDGITVSIDGEYTEWDIAVLKSYTTIVPEEKDNTDNVTNNFSYVSRGKFKFYPMYRESSSRHTVGIYITDDAGKNAIKIPLYSNWEGDELQYNTVKDIHEEQPSDNKKFYWEVGSQCKNGHVITRIGEDGKRYYGDNESNECTDDPKWEIGSRVIVDDCDPKDYPRIRGRRQPSWASGDYTCPYYFEWHNVEQQQQYAINLTNTGITHTRAKGISVDLPLGTKFGFYCVVYNYDKDNAKVDEASHHTVYSEEELNKEEGLKDPAKWNGTNCDSNSYAFGASFATRVNGKTYTFFGFEDWNNSGPDLNDIIFMFDDTNRPIVIEEDPANKWIIACEDLGGTHDFDFNDLVFGITYVSGRAIAQITPLAAGGTLPIELWFRYKNKTTGNFIEGRIGDGEIHQMFGVASNVPVNVKAPGGADQRDAGTYEINIDNNFTLSDNAEHSGGTVVDSDGNNMGGFFVKVMRDGLNWTDAVTAPGKGEAPQMILIQAVNADDDDPDSGIQQNYWRWMRESQRITLAYPGFEEWGANHANNIWHRNLDSSNEDKVVAPYSGF